MNIPARKRLLTTADELAAQLGDRRLRIVDCRFDLMAPTAGAGAWLDAHIPGAVYADLDRDLSGPVDPATGRHPLPDVAAAEETISNLGIDADTRVVVYDDSGGAFASRAWWLLRYFGHDDVTVLDGGLRAWRDLELPLERGARTAPRRRFRGKAHPERVVTTREVAGDFEALRVSRLIDARDRARFLGKTEPIDARAGHIPGTRNLPFTECLGESGTWLDAAALRRRLEPLLGEDAGAPWAVMCGSGVTACHLAISGLLAGYGEPRVYIGSWSEWIRDPSRPVESCTGT